MRIAVFTDTFVPEINGVVTSAKKLLLGLEERGHEIFVFCPKYKTNVKKIGTNIRIIRSISAPLPRYKEVRMVLPNPTVVAHRIRKIKPDIIYTLTPAGMGFLGLSVAKMFRLPSVSTFHTYVADPNYLKHINLHRIKGAETAIWTVMSTTMNRYTALTSPSVATMKAMKKHGFKKPIKVISNGIDTSKIHQKRRYGGEKYIIYVGRISVEKSIGVLIKAMNLVVRSHPKLKLMIVGGGPAIKEMKGLAKEYDLEKNIKFTGPIPHDKLLKSQKIQKAGIFVTASLSENQPMTILESMAAGIPVIGMNARGVPEMIKGNGYICPPDDHGMMAKRISKLMGDARLRKRMGMKSRRLAETHDVEKSVAKMEELFRLCIERKNNKGKFKRFFS
jgi:glycosyltransferase involved in cell wall biosynthesis